MPSHARPRPRSVAVASAGAAVLAGAVAYAGWSAAAEGSTPDRPRPGGLTAGPPVVSGELVLGGVVTGSLVVSSTSDRPVPVTAAAFEPATTPTAGCTGSSVVFALTVAPSAATPLVVPAAPDSGVPVGYTAYLTGAAEDACQGATFTSVLRLDGDPVGSARAAAGALPPPGQAQGGQTTPTRAAVRWTAAPGARAYFLERTPTGTAAWEPACGCSAATPLVTTACTDTGLAPGTAYAYRVTAARGSWRSISRLSTDVTTQPAGAR